MRLTRAALVLLSVLLPPPAIAEDCIASVYWIGESSQPGTATASGVKLDDQQLTAAHKSLPFGTKVEVENLENGKKVVVIITDRGPFVAGRCIDLTLGSARALGLGKQGTARVRLTVLGR